MYKDHSREDLTLVSSPAVFGGNKMGFDQWDDEAKVTAEEATHADGLKHAIGSTLPKDCCAVLDRNDQNDEWRKVFLRRDAGLVVGLFVACLGGRAPRQMVRTRVARTGCTSHGRVRPSRVSAPGAMHPRSERGCIATTSASIGASARA